MASDGALLDTNILVYALDPSSEFHAASKAVRDRGLLGKETLYLTAHILYEFVAVVTNPAVVTSPLSPAEAHAEAEKLAMCLPLLHPKTTILDAVIRLLRQTGIAGKRVYDVVHIATMLDTGVTRVYTFDAKFPVVPGVTILRPRAP